MITNKIKRSTIALLAVAAIGVTAMPAFASAKGLEMDFRGGIGNIIRFNPIGNIFNNNSVKSARTTYNQAIKDANTAYKNAQKAAHSKYISALLSAGNDFNKRLAAYKNYLSDIMIAFNQKSSAKASALQKYIDMLGGIQTTTNQIPVAYNQNTTLNQNSSKAITLTGSDPEGSTLTFTVVTSPTHGTLSGTTPNLTYTPNTNYNGADNFTFKVNDGTQDSQTATVSISIAAVNQTPSANNQTVTASKNASKSIVLTGSDLESSSLSFYVLTNPTHGTLSGTAPNLVYLPNTDFTGIDSFTFKANDGSLDSIPATVTITVNP